MRTPQGRQEAPERSGSLKSSEDDEVRLPPGFDFAADTNEERDELQDLEPEGPEAEEGIEPEGEPEELTPEEIRALRKELKSKDELLGKLGKEVGDLRQQVTAPERVQAPPPTGPQVDPYAEDVSQALDEFLRTGDVKTTGERLSRNFNARLMAGAQYLHQSILAETTASSDFFAKNSDLVDGTPRAVFEGELAKAKLQNPRVNLQEQRDQAAKATRELLQELNWKLVEEDADAARAAKGLKGPGGRKSRTGSETGGPTGGMEAIRAGTQAYRRLAQEHQQRTRSGR